MGSGIFTRRVTHWAKPSGVSVACALLACLTVAGGAPAAQAIPSASAPKPVVSRLSATSAPLSGGTRVTVTGKYFAKVSKVVFGSTAGTSLKVLSSTSLQVTAPKHAAGTVNVEVVAKAGTSQAVAADRFTYVSPPSVSKLSVTSGPSAGGTKVTVSGRNFTKVSKVAFGATQGTALRVLSASSLQVVAPRHTAGIVDVRVVTAYGESGVVKADRYSYARPAEALAWSKWQRVDGLGDQSMRYAGCPSTTDCFAIDDIGNVATWNGSTWSKPVATPVLDNDTLGIGGDTSCVPSQGFCVTVGDAGAFTYSGGTWTYLPVKGVNSLGWVSCVSATFCAAVDYSGDVTTYDGTAWSTPVNVDPSATGNSDSDDISCGSSTFCVLSNASGEILTWNGSAWTNPAALPGESGVLVVSCPSATFCMAVDANGDVFTYGGSAWTAAGADNGNSSPTQVVCTSSTFCMVADQGGDFAQYNGASWSVASGVIQLSDGSYPYPDLACADQTCATTGGANVSLASTFADGTWAAQVTVDSTGELDAISCPTTTFCAAVGAGLDAVTMHNGTWDAPVPLPGATEPNSVSCTSATFCLASDYNGLIWRYNGTTWTQIASPPNAISGLTAISCATSTFCVWVDSAISVVGDVSVYNGSTWTAVKRIDGAYGWTAVSCPSVKFCAATDGNGNVATFNGTTWSALKAVYKLYEVSLSCISASFCAIPDGTGADIFNGSKWTHANLSASNDFIFGISCATSTFCAATSSSGLVFTYDGTQWSSPYPTQATYVNAEAGALSCPSPKFCATVGGYGDVSVGTSR
jgi:hypothetical protein